MTILVAVKKDGRTFIGADRITTFGNEYHTDIVGNSKIMKLKHAYLASSGYTLMDNVIEHLYSTGHEILDNPFESRAGVFSFFLELYNLLKKTYTLTDTGKDTYAGIYNTFLLVTPSAIFGVSNNLSVHEYQDYAAQGSGADYALGCLFGIYETVDDPVELVRISLEAACRFNIYCKEPLDVLEVREDDFGRKRGYKSHGRGLRTYAERKGPGNLTSGRKTTRKSSSGSKTTRKTTRKKSSS